MCIHIYIYIYIHIHMYVHMYVCVYIYIYTHLCHIYVRSLIHTHLLNNPPARLPACLPAKQICPPKRICLPANQICLATVGQSSGTDCNSDVFGNSPLVARAVRHSISSRGLASTRICMYTYIHI